MTDTELAERLKEYRPSDSAIDLVRRANLVLLVGISGAGKDTLKQELLKRDNYYNFISHTTRAPRANLGIMEQDGTDYHFISTEQAIAMLKNGEFIEAKKYSANIYGTTAKGLTPSVETDKIAVNDIEVQGVEEYVGMSSSVNCVFVLPPSYEEWQRRLTSRYEGVINQEDFDRRIETSRDELSFALRHSEFKFVINQNIEDAVTAVEAIVEGKYEPELQRSGRACAEKLLDELSTH